MGTAMEIILIEDNEEDAERMLKFLKANFTNNIRHFQDGAEAVKFLLFDHTDIPKLILLDLVLPSVDGLEIFHIIRSEPVERKLSVIFLISSIESKNYIESLGIHPDGFLKKATREKMPARIE
jgi:CheY-like chemotaxis protein